MDIHTSQNHSPDSTTTNQDVQSLRHNHDRFVQIAEINQAVIWEVDPNGLYTYVSPICRKVFGYEPDELVGIKHFYELHPESSSNGFRDESLKQISEQRIFDDFHNPVLRKDGTVITVTTNGIPYYDETGAFKGYRGSAVDITELLNARKDQADSHALLARLTTQIPGVVYQYQLFPDGSSCFPYSSEGMLEIYGLHPEQVKHDASEVFNRIHQEDVDRLGQEIMESAERLTPFYSEFRVVLPGKGISWRQCTANPERLDDGSTLWHGLITNVTERKRISDTLQKAYLEMSTLRKALDSVPVAVYMKDTESRYTYANRLTLDLLMNPDDDIIGRGDHNFFDAETARSLRRIDQRVLSGKNNSQEVETTLITGEQRVYLEIKSPIYDRIDSEKVIGLLGISTDITESKSAERKIMDSEEYLRSLLTAIPNALFIIDRNGIFLDYKADAKDLYVQNESFIGKSLSEVLPEEVAEILTTAMVESINSREIVECEYALYIRAELKYFSCRMIAFGDERVISSVTDITESVHNLNRIKNLLKAEEDQNKRLRNFTHIVSHNLRSHTANMQGLLYLLEDESPDIFANQYVRLLKVSSDNLRETIQHLNQVLDINLIGDKEWEEQNVYDRIQAEIQSVAQLASNAGITISNLVDTKLKITVIPAYLSSIILNMLTNAIKYRSDDREAFLKITSSHLTDTIELRFEDNGLGIDMDRHRDKIFGMYKTFHTKEDAKGLGLFMVKTQVEAMGGTIAVHSEVHKGTTFTIKLPVKPLQILS
jgi:PAS domain S-box-containing protein